MPVQAMEQNMGGHDMAHDQNAYSDRIYLSGMIAHHEGAVQMSEALLAAPKKQQDPQVAAWAKQIIKAQKEEIEQMKAWLKDVGGLDQKADLLKLGQEIIEAQAAEMHAFRTWLNDRGDHNI